MRAIDYVVFVFVVLWVFWMGESLAHANCHQPTYDAIYKQIIINAKSQEPSPEVFEQRSLTIETLRRLCFGQTSTYEVRSHCRGAK